VEERVLRNSPTTSYARDLTRTCSKLRDICYNRMHLLLVMEIEDESLIDVSCTGSRQLREMGTVPVRCRQANVL
jgi:hypothetical protein